MRRGLASAAICPACVGLKIPQMQTTISTAWILGATNYAAMKSPFHSAAVREKTKAFISAVWNGWVVVHVNSMPGNTQLEHPTPALKEGDANNDNCVTASDFNIMKNSYGRSPNDPGYDARADFNGDNLVTISDFNLLKANFGLLGAGPIAPDR